MHANSTLTVKTNLQENLEIFANRNEIKVPIETKDVDAAAGATSVKDDGERIGRFTIGRKFTVRESVNLNGLVGRGRRHEVKNERDEEERECNHQEGTAELIDLIGERLRRRRR